MVQHGNECSVCLATSTHLRLAEVDARDSESVGAGDTGDPLPGGNNDELEGKEKGNALRSKEI